MSAQNIRTGSVIGPPLEYTTQDRLLAEILAKLTEILHELKKANGLVEQDVEIARRMALDLLAIRRALGALLQEIRNVVV